MQSNRVERVGNVVVVSIVAAMLIRKGVVDKVGVSGDDEAIVLRAQVGYNAILQERLENQVVVVLLADPGGRIGTGSGLLLWFLVFFIHDFLASGSALCLSANDSRH